MEYRVLGKSGIRVSVFGVGTWHLSGPMSLDGRADGFPDPGRQAVVDLIRSCGELGINLIDCAEIYGDGEGERRVGEALAGRRADWVVVTKFGMRRGSAGERLTDVGPSAIRASIEGSLRRLRTDYVDVYLYHAPPSAESMAAGVAELDRLRAEGKIREYGISTSDSRAAQRVLTGSVASQLMSPQSLMTHRAGILDLVNATGCGLLVRGALESGKLSGKYFARPPVFAPDDFRSRSPVEEYTKQVMWERVRPAHMPMTNFALRYVLDFTSTSAVVLGGKSLDDYRLALATLDFPRLSEETHLAIQRLRSKPAGGGWLGRAQRWFGRA